ncbi:MAG: hypothetical protein ABR980_00905 [Ignavibacteriaceae bacterium]
MISDRSSEHPSAGASTKKALILEVAEGLGKPRYTPAEIEQIRRQLIAQLGATGKTSPDYIVSVLEEAGLRVVWSTRSDTDGRYEEEFTDLLHFSTLEEAEMCLVRLDELLRKFLLQRRSNLPAIRQHSRNSFNILNPGSLKGFCGMHGCLHSREQRKIFQRY